MERGSRYGVVIIIINSSCNDMGLGNWIYVHPFTPGWVLWQSQGPGILAKILERSNGWLSDVESQQWLHLPKFHEENEAAVRGGRSLGWHLDLGWVEPLDAVGGAPVPRPLLQAWQRELLSWSCTRVRAAPRVMWLGRDQRSRTIWRTLGRISR